MQLDKGIIELSTNSVSHIYGKPKLQPHLKNLDRSYFEGHNVSVNISDIMVNKIIDIEEYELLVIPEIKKVIEIITENSKTPYIVATGIYRRCDNIDEIRSLILKHTKLHFYLIDKDFEAYLSAKSFIELSPPSWKKLYLKPIIIDKDKNKPENKYSHLYFEIGGGSMQFAIIDNEKGGVTIKNATGFDVGYHDFVNYFLASSYEHDLQTILKQTDTYIKSEINNFDIVQGSNYSSSCIGSSNALKFVIPKEEREYNKKGQLLKNFHGVGILKSTLLQHLREYEEILFKKTETLSEFKIKRLKSEKIRNYLINRLTVSAYLYFMEKLDLNAITFSQITVIYGFYLSFNLNEIELSDN